MDDNSLDKICELSQVDRRMLDTECSEAGINTMAECFVDWESIAPYLEISEVEIKDIKEENSNNHQRQRVRFLMSWKEKNGHNATYSKFFEILINLGKLNIPHKIIKLLKERIGIFKQNFFVSYKHWPIPLCVYSTEVLIQQVLLSPCFFFFFCPFKTLCMAS